MQTSTHIIALISSIVVPVLLPTYSKTQNDFKKLRNIILNVQKHLGILLLPIGLGIFLYSDLITNILLGGQWHESAPIIGIWGLMHAFTLLLSRNYTNAFIAIGKPKIPVIVQAIYAAILIPAIILSADISFNCVYITRSFMRIWHIALNMLFIFITIRLSIFKTLSNLIPEFIGCLVFFIISTLLSLISESPYWQLISIIICAITYFSIIFLFKKEKIIIYQAIKHIKNLLKPLSVSK